MGLERREDVPHRSAIGSVEDRSHRCRSASTPTVGVPGASDRSSAVPPRAVGSLDHGPLELARRIVHGRDVPLQLRGGAIDDLDRQPPVERDRGGETHEARALLAQQRRDVGGGLGRSVEWIPGQEGVDDPAHDMCPCISPT